MNAALQRLRAEVASDLRAFAARVQELAALGMLRRDSPAMLAQAAVALHHGYGAVEAALVRIVRTLEGGVPEGRDWHQSLLANATLDIEAVRPRLLSDSSAAALRRLLGFRHFFRHAYGAPFDASRLEELRTVAVAAQADIEADFRAIDLLLARLASDT